MDKWFSTWCDYFEIGAKAAVLLLIVLPFFLIATVALFPFYLFGRLVRRVAPQTWERWRQGGENCEKQL